MSGRRSAFNEENNLARNNFAVNFYFPPQKNTTLLCISFDSEKNCPRFDNEIFVILRNSGYQDCFFLHLWSAMMKQLSDRPINKFFDVIVLRKPKN